MTTNNSATNPERLIELSLHPLDYSGTATDYRLNDIKVSDFENVFTELNYSPIIWKDSYRTSENFLYATGFCNDLDKGITIDEAEASLLKNNLNYFLCATKVMLLPNIALEFLYHLTRNYLLTSNI